MQKEFSRFFSIQMTDFQDNGLFSNCQLVNQVMALGIVLRPLKSLLYVNDFSTTTTTRATEKLILFADYASIVCRGRECSLNGKVKEILTKREKMRNQKTCFR